MMPVRQAKSCAPRHRSRKCSATMRFWRRTREIARSPTIISSTTDPFEVRHRPRPPPAVSTAPLICCDAPSGVPRACGSNRRELTTAAPSDRVSSPARTLRRPIQRSGAMASQVLAATVIRVLSHPVIMKINFELNGLLVTGMRYQVVAQAVRSGKITCEIGTDRDPNLPAGTVIAAEYKSDPKPHFMFPREDFG